MSAVTSTPHVTAAVDTGLGGSGVSRVAEAPLGAASLVRDIDTGGSGTPEGITAFAGGVLFSAQDAAHGREPWFADASGAHRLRDIRSGATSSSPRSFTVVGDQAFFSADDGTHGRELWVTDGTQNGTRLVRDIRPGAKDSGPDFLTAFEGRLWFGARDANHGRELWRSDGTRAGTKLFLDIQANGSSLYRAGFRDPQPWVVFHDRLYFGVQYDHAGLWRTDGTRDGTRRVFGGTYPRQLTATTTRLYFVAIARGGGCAVEDLLWTSDGTRAGTREVASIYSDQPIVTLGGRAYFVMGSGHGRRLFRNQGSWNVHGEVKPKVSIDDGTGLQVVARSMFLSQDDGLSISDGTGVGTTPLGGSITDWVAAVDMVRLGDLWYFPAGIGSAADLWQTDGTPGGTSLAADIGPDEGSDIHALVRSGGAVWFSADDGTHGRELWRYDP